MHFPPLFPRLLFLCDTTLPSYRWGGWRSTRVRAFTLVELLVVMGVIVILIGLIAPALTPLKRSQDVTAAAYNLRGVLETARTYAVANHTYVWMGLYEQDYKTMAAPSPTGTPPYSGIGHVTVGLVYSRDGTKLIDDSVSGSVTLPAANISQVGPVMQIYAVHLCALSAPSSPNSDDPIVSATLRGRPYQTDLNAAQLEPTLISSASADSTSRPFVAQGYTFYKTIRFNPRGEANVNSTNPCTRIVEIGLQPTHGNVADSATPNQVAIQLSGIGGAVTIYRP